MSDDKRWFIGPDHLGSYMRRWLVRTPWFTLRLHNILTSDEGRDFHDHPFGFVSLILKGGYVEHRPGCVCFSKLPGVDSTGPGFACRRYRAGSVLRRRAADLHRLELRRPAWTFVITTRYFRDWGFQTPSGWVDFRSYHRTFYKRTAEAKR